MLLNHRAAFDYEQIAERDLQEKSSDVRFDFLTGSADGGTLVACGAGLCVEQRTEARFLGENARELRLPALEPGGRLYFEHCAGRHVDRLDYSEGSGHALRTEIELHDGRCINRQISFDTRESGTSRPDNCR